MTRDRLHEGNVNTSALAVPMWGTLSLAPAVQFAVIAVFAATGLALQWTTYLNHDVAWVLYSAGRMLQGAVFGRDIVAANPPLIWFVSMPAVLVSKWSGWPVDAVFRVLVAGAGIASLAYCWRAMRAEPSVARFATVTALAYYLFIGCGRDYGQREHLSLILVLPYLASAAALSNGRRANRPAVVLVGVAAGIGFAFKPYFLAIPMLVELVLLRATGTPRSLARLDTLAMAATMLLYAAVVVIGTPEYLTSAVPLITKVYWGFASEPVGIAIMALPTAIAFIALLSLRFIRPQQVMTSILCAAAGGYAISFLIQFKGYTYHAMPMAALALAAAVREISDLVWDDAPRSRQMTVYRLLSKAFIVISVILSAERAGLWLYLAVKPDGRLAQEISGVIDLVNTYARNDSYLAISTHPFPGFPTAIYVNSAWAGRTNSQIALPAVVKLQELGAEADPSTLQQTEALARAMFLQDLASAKPALLLVDVHKRRHAIGDDPIDLLEFYRGDPTIDAILREYREMPQSNGFRVFVRDLPS